MTYQFPNDNNNATQAKNYCRFLDPDDEKPWCYITLSETTNPYYEYCDIPLCGEFRHIDIFYLFHHDTTNFIIYSCVIHTSNELSAHFIHSSFINTISLNCVRIYNIE